MQKTKPNKWKLQYAAFNEIKNSIDTITENIQMLNNAMMELARYKDEIIESIANITAVSEETAASTEEVAASNRRTHEIYKRR